jgi:hypothetical protein
VRSGGGGSSVNYDDAAACPAITFGRVLQRLSQGAAATKLRGNNHLAIGQRDVRCTSADGGLQLLRFASVEACGTGLDQNAALSRHCLYQLKTKFLAAAGSEDDS